MACAMSVSVLSVPSKPAVVLFSGHSGFFPHFKNRLRPLRWHDSSCPVYGLETHIKPPGFALPIAIVAKCEEIINLAQKI